MSQAICLVLLLVTSRAIGLKYGHEPPTTAINNALCRVTLITDTVSGGTQEAAAYTYTGSGRRVSTRLGRDAAAQSFSDGSLGSVGYARLSALGQPADLHYKHVTATTSETFFRAQMAYSESGERIRTRLTQAAIGGLHDNDRSNLFAYDKLQRLIANGTGVLAQDQNQDWVINDPSGGQAHEVQMAMDTLGNFVGAPLPPPGGGNAPGRRIRGQLDGDPDEDTHNITHTVGLQNQITSIIEARPDGTTPTTTFYYDKAGNLTCDGAYYYQYDGWNRLIQVNQKGSLEFSSTNGQPTGTGTAGPWILHYTYDALGRLMRKQVPYGAPLPNGDTQVRTEHYYYDGVRRIAETITDPLTIIGGGTVGGNPGDPIGVGGEAQITGGGNPGGGGGNPPPAANTWTDREYIYSPGYVDEFVAQVDKNGKRWYVIQDASYDTAALVEEEVPATATTPSVARVAVQYSWDPYGELLAMDEAAGIDDTSPAVTSRLGHHGLFFDRLNGVIGDIANPQLQTDAKGLYYNRNRTYAPSIGRFMQRDPNGCGLVLATGGLLLDEEAPDSPGLFEDGANIYCYLAGDPIAGVDPGGLFFGLAGTALTAGYNAWENASGSLEQAAMGLSLGFLLQEMIDTYTFMQEEDADWAADWSRHDFDNYTGGVITDAYGYGMEVESSVGDEEFDKEYGLDDLTPPVDGNDFQVGVKVHRNSSKSQALNHLYQLAYKKPGAKGFAIGKFGISGTKIINGTSKRAQVQVARLQKKYKGWKFNYKILQTRIPGRKSALAIESVVTNIHRGTGGTLIFQKRPQTNPRTPKPRRSPRLATDRRRR